MHAELITKHILSHETHHQLLCKIGQDVTVIETDVS